MARYHYNPNSGAVGICRADPSKPNSKGCRFQLSEGEHFGSAAEASRAYEATQDPFGGSSSASGRRLTSEQESYFQKSAVRDSQGRLLEVHHGSSKDFDSFDPSVLGRGNDSWGNGFYFTTEKGTADGYSAGRGSREFYLAVENPIRVDGKEAMSLVDVQLTPEQNRRIMLAHPDLQIQPDADSDRQNPLGDYSSEYWEKEHHTPAELRRLAEKVAREYFDEAGWVELESFYGRDNGQAFLRAVSETTGHDGVEVDFGEEHGKHFVAWFPEQIKLSSNGSPTDSAAISS